MPLRTIRQGHRSCQAGEVYGRMLGGGATRSLLAELAGWELSRPKSQPRFSSLRSPKRCHTLRSICCTRTRLNNKRVYAHVFRTTNTVNRLITCNLCNQTYSVAVQIAMAFDPPRSLCKRSDLTFRTALDQLVILGWNSFGNHALLPHGPIETGKRPN